MITVIDVFKEKGVEPDSKKTWAVGQMVQEHWSKEHDGALPEKQLCPKTNGAGKHCMAIYPDEYRPIIAGYIDRVAAEAAKQMDWVGYEQ